MARFQARALFDFESGGPGELSFQTDEVLNILRQDIGAGWWEASNASGHNGLVPESYLEIIGYQEPAIPPPPPPSKPSNQQQPFYPSLTQHSGAQSNAGQDEWDDDWDDDDDSSTTTEHHDQTVDANGVRNVKPGQDDKGKAVKVSGLNRFSTFAKSGGDAYLFESYKELPESDKPYAVIDGPDGPMWQQNEDVFSCSVTSPKKESKFHGIKTYIAYQIIPSFSNIQVSRRYKHFDWLQQRLAVKFSTICIPPLPEKQISGRFEDVFVNQRLRQLQMWIDRMCQHPVVSRSEVFKHFLTCTDDKKWKVGKRKAEKDEFCGGMFFREVSIPQYPALDNKQADMQIEKFGKFVKSMDDSLRHLTTVAESNVKKHQGPFKKEFEKLGGSITALAKSFEYDERPASLNLTQAIEHTGRTYEEIGELFARQPQNDMMYLLEGLHSYKGLLGTLPDALLIHKGAQTKIVDQSAKMTASELQRVQGRADVMSYAVLAEMENFQRKRVEDLSSYMRTYLSGQIAFFQEITAKLEESLNQYR